MSVHKYSSSTDYLEFVFVPTDHFGGDAVPVRGTMGWPVETKVLQGTSGPEQEQNCKVL